MNVVFVRNGKEMDSGGCFRSLNLLAHAQMIELEVGSRCGGHGKCGKDRVILAPEDWRYVNPPTAIEKAHLTSSEIASGVRLACQCFPGEDGCGFKVRIE